MQHAVLVQAQGRVGLIHMLYNYITEEQEWMLSMLVAQQLWISSSTDCQTLLMLQVQDWLQKQTLPSFRGLERVEHYTGS